MTFIQGKRIFNFCKYFSDIYKIKDHFCFTIINYKGKCLYFNRRGVCFSGNLLTVTGVCYILTRQLIYCGIWKSDSVHLGHT